MTTPTSAVLSSRCLLQKAIRSTSRKVLSPRAQQSINCDRLSWFVPQSATNTIARSLVVTPTMMRCNDTIEITDKQPDFVMPTYKPPETYTVSPTVEKIFQDILTLHPHDVAVIGHVLMSRLGISNEEMMMIVQARLGGGAPGGSAGGGQMAEAAAAPVEEKKIFDLKLMGFDERSKIKVIKEIRAITGLGLKEAKDLVEGVPKVVKKDVKKEEAEQIKAVLEKVGAVVEIA